MQQYLSEEPKPKPLYAVLPANHEMKQSHLAGSGCTVYSEHVNTLTKKEEPNVARGISTEYQRSRIVSV